MATNTNIQTPNERKPQKRQADQSFIVSDDDDDDRKCNNFQSFFVVEPRDGKIINLSIFGIQKLLKCAVGDVKSAKKLRSGAVLVEVSSKQQADNALKMTTWVDVPIKVTPHRSLNSSKGVIRSRDLRDCDEAEVLDALRAEGVTHVKHLTSKRDGAVFPTNTFILTFNRPKPPQYVKAAYLVIPVETFVPNPLRCFNCQRFGHGKTNCNRPAMCAKCGKEGHNDAECRESAHCCNCSGPHPAFSRVSGVGQTAGNTGDQISTWQLLF